MLVVESEKFLISLNVWILWGSFKVDPCFLDFWSQVQHTDWWQNQRRNPKNLHHECSLLCSQRFSFFREISWVTFQQLLVGAHYVEMRVNSGQYAVSASKLVENMFKISGSKNCSEIDLDYLSWWVIQIIFDDDKRLDHIHINCSTGSVQVTPVERSADGVRTVVQWVSDVHGQVHRFYSHSVKRKYRVQLECEFAIIHKPFRAFAIDNIHLSPQSYPTCWQFNESIGQDDGLIAEEVIKHTQKVYYCDDPLMYRCVCVSRFNIEEDYHRDEGDHEDKDRESIFLVILATQFIWRVWLKKVNLLTRTGIPRQYATHSRFLIIKLK